ASTGPVNFSGVLTSGRLYVGTTAPITSGMCTAPPATFFARSSCSGVRYASVQAKSRNLSSSPATPLVELPATYSTFTPVCFSYSPAQCPISGSTNVEPPPRRMTPRTGTGPGFGFTFGGGVGLRFGSVGGGVGLPAFCCVGRVMAHTATPMATRTIATTPATRPRCRRGEEAAGGEAGGGEPAAGCGVSTRGRGAGEGSPADQGASGSSD